MHSCKVFSNIFFGRSPSIQDKILKQINDASIVICLSKKIPDGNALGSQFGLKSFIKANWLDKEVYAPGNGNPSLSFFGTPDKIDDSKYKNALVIILGVPTKNFLTVDYAFLKANAKFIIRIDHHPLTIPFANLEWIDPTSPSTTQMLAILVAGRKYVYPSLMARNWFGGLVTDTDQLNYGMIDKRTGNVLQFLFAQNFDVQEILRKINNRSSERVMIENYVLQNINFHNNSGLITCTIPHKIVAQVPQHSLNNLIGILWGVSNAQIIAFVTIAEDQQNAIGQIRAINVVHGVAEVAQKYNGGGHDWSAGAYFSSDRIDDFFADLEKLLIPDQN